MKNILKIGIVMLILLLVNCKGKEPEPQQETAAQVNRESKQAEDSYQSSQDFVEKAMENTQVQAREAQPTRNKNFDTYFFTAYNTNNCATITVEGDATSPNATGTVLRTITLDFGTTGCVGTDGRTRKGKIIYSYLRPAATGAFNPHNNIGTVVSLSFDNHYVNGIKLEGTGTSTCTAFSMAQNLITRTQNIVITGGKLIYSDNTNQLWDCNRVRSFSVNYNNTGLMLETAQGFLSGTNNGRTRQGTNYTSTINNTPTDRCVWKLACPPIMVPSIEPNVFDPVVLPVQGKMNVVYGQNSALFDFGAGNCDNQYTITINGVVTTITI
ncbi:MAG: hypothetical protein EAZ85_16125 [Bacteroidetes bacterium]|nr:MAG: hypothetical protein EAZ85_16125 [Bacteroidota bacterium]TAG91530.1 MAG: hypothetical protein EAZ20_03235 [Bacteroidota bacterium]